jgi:hypothetical protein
MIAKENKFSHEHIEVLVKNIWERYKILQDRRATLIGKLKFILAVSSAIMSVQLMSLNGTNTGILTYLNAEEVFPKFWMIISLILSICTCFKSASIMISDHHVDDSEDIDALYLLCGNDRLFWVKSFHTAKDKYKKALDVNSEYEWSILSLFLSMLFVSVLMMQAPDSSATTLIAKIALVVSILWLIFAKRPQRKQCHPTPPPPSSFPNPLDGGDAAD